MIYLQLFWSFLQVGLFSFGGGYAAMPLIEEQIVTRHGWLSMQEFTDLITISQMTPGPIAVNSATFVGIKIAGIPGALVATFGCILPSCILVIVLAKLYFKYRNMQMLQGVLGSLRPAVVAMIAAAGVSVAVLSLVNTDAFMAREWASVVEPKSIVLAAILLILTNKVKKTKNLHPVFYIAASAVVGIVFHFAGI